MNRLGKGFTLPELIMTIVVFSIIALSTYSLLIGFINTSSLAQLKSAAVEVATSEMEMLRSVPYNKLAVSGGAIVITDTYLPASKEITRSSRKFLVETDIRYADDAYDGCFNYPSPEQRDRYCRNGPPDASKPVDNNPRDYKVAQVTVKTLPTGEVLASMSSQFAARVAEVASDTSMISVKVADSTGAGIPGATVRLTNSEVTPQIDQTITTDDVGSALFMDIVPDNNKKYVVSVSKPGYSSLTTIADSGLLTPTYPNVLAIAQNMTNSTLVIDRVASNSLAIKIVNTSGAPVVNRQVSLRGGVKLYTDVNDQQFSYSETHTTDGSGNLTLGSLVPGKYTVTGVAGENIIAVHTAAGDVPYQPFNVPPGSSPSAGMTAMQMITIVVSTNSAYPRISSVKPISAMSSDVNITEFPVVVSGFNLSGATVKMVGKNSGAVIEGTTTVDPDQNEMIIRNFNLQSASQEGYRLEVTTGAGTAVQDSVNPSTRGAINVIP